MDRLMRRGTLLLIMAMVAMSSARLEAAVPDSAGGGSFGTGKGFGETTTLNVIDDQTVNQMIMEGAVNNCFLETIKFDTVDECQILYIPMICLRMRNNVPGNIIEAVDKRNHFSVQTQGTKQYLQQNGVTTAPLNKHLGIDDISGASGGSGRGMARTIASPILFSTIFQIASGVAYDVLCNPPMFGNSYIYFAEGDETDWGESIWRKIISPYYTDQMTSGLSFFATSLETAGLCGLDLDFIVCFGGWGAKYPTSGLFPAKSPELMVITAMWRAQEIHAAVAERYGSYDTSLGIGVHSRLHNQKAVGQGESAMLAPYSPASYIQWFQPGVVADPYGNPQSDCGVLGLDAGTNYQVATQILNETFDKTWIEENSVSFFYWPRFVCCNWCSLSNQTAAKHVIPEESYDATLTRKK